jgi:dihydrofolate synthase/folylpolyglutamate synthase
MARRWTAQAYLRSRARLGTKFGLDTIRAVIEALGHPERSYHIVLIAGTNGKGSVTAYLDHALRGGGLRVGRYTSPHLVRLNERIAVGGREISDAALERSIRRVWEASRELVRAGRIPAHPTHFEILTAAGLLYFRERRIDVALLEVGLGGRLDATNVCDPLASAIVSIDFDHEAFLGNTLASIAREKAGVLRRARIAVLGPLADEPRRAIAVAASESGAILLDALAGVSSERQPDGVRVRTPAGRYRGLRPLPGEHQLTNMIVALRLLEVLHGSGLRFDLAAAARALSRTRWPGRLQSIPGRPSLLLDGAHNPAAARALARALRDVPDLVLLFGVMRDKDVEAIARTLFPLAREVVLTRPRLARAAAPAEIARRAGRLAAGAHRVPQPRRALALARRLAGDGVVVVSGSLFLVGAVLELVRSERARLRARRAASPAAGAGSARAGRGSASSPIRDRRRRRGPTRRAGTSPGTSRSRTPASRRRRSGPRAR